MDLDLEWTDWLNAKEWFLKLINQANQDLMETKSVLNRDFSMTEKCAKTLFIIAKISADLKHKLVEGNLISVKFLNEQVSKFYPDESWNKNEHNKIKTKLTKLGLISIPPMYEGLVKLNVDNFDTCCENIGDELEKMNKYQNEIEEMRTRLTIKEDPMSSINIEKINMEEKIND